MTLEQIRPMNLAVPRTNMLLALCDTFLQYWPQHICGMYVHHLHVFMIVLETWARRCSRQRHASLMDKVGRSKRSRSTIATIFLWNLWCAHVIEEDEEDVDKTCYIGSKSKEKTIKWYFIWNGPQSTCTPPPVITPRNKIVCCDQLFSRWKRDSRLCWSNNHHVNVVLSSLNLGLQVHHTEISQDLIARCKWWVQHWSK